MGNRSRHKSRHARTKSARAPMAHLMRTHCTECGSSVQWLSTEEARQRGIDLAPALQFFGEDKPADVWVCSSCDNFGVMGTTVGGFF